MSAGVEGESLDVLESQDRARFEQLVLPHLDAAFNLSRWLMRGRADAEDVAQEAMVRAWENAARFDPSRAKFSTCMVPTCTSRAPSPTVA